MSKTQIVWIDGERCTGCGACIETCPVGAISLINGEAQVDGESCTGCWICLDVCPQEAIQPVVEGALVQAVEPRAISDSARAVSGRALTSQRSRPLVETAAPALAVAGAGLLAKATRAIVRAVSRWLTQSREGTSLTRPEQPSQLSTRRTNGRGYRVRRRRRGR